MKTIVAKRKELNLKDYVHRFAVDADYDTLITENTKVVDENGRVLILYFKIDDDVSDMVWACNQIDYQESTRTNGLKTRSAVFGYEPRKTMRKDYCSATKMATDQPKPHHIVTNFGKKLAEIYRREVPDVYNSHMKVTEDKIKDEWRITDTPFTSGIINKTNRLKYHFDSGNFDSVYSNMIVFKHRVGGGHLACPEFGLGFECADKSIVMFDGQKILHGVTDIIEKGRGAFRYSVVYYSLQQMWNCDTIDEELLRIREVKKLRELKRRE